MEATRPTKTHPAPAIADERLTALRSAVRGPILRPGEPGYDAARRLYNGMIDRRPAVIVQCQDVPDVIEAVRFAKRQDLRLSVKAGGHGVAGTALVEGGVVVDLSRMRAVLVDPDRREVTVQGGAVWADVDRATQLHGLAIPGGLVSSTGVGGFTLGGGIGWLSRRYGLACDNLIAAELVNADGEVVRADEAHHPELLWALRGGGGNFGVVTAFRFRAHPLGPMIVGGLRMFPIDRAPAVLRAVADALSGGPRELNALAVLALAPPAPFIPAELHGKPVVALALAYLGPPEKADAALRSLRSLPGAAVDQVGPMPYVALQSFLDAMAPPGLQNYWKSACLDALPDAAIQRLLERFREVPSPMTEVHIQGFGGHAVAEAEDGSAVGNRRSPFVVNLVGRWTESGQGGPTRTFVRSVWDDLRAYGSGGVYVNFLADESADVVRSSYGAAHLERLAAVKRTYDPSNFFQGNHNISPAAARTGSGRA